MPGRGYRSQAAVLLLVCIVASLALRVLAFVPAASSTALGLLSSKTAAAAGRLPPGMVRCACVEYHHIEIDSINCWVNLPIHSTPQQQSQTRASKRAKTSTVAMALYQGKPGSSMMDAMSAAVAEGTLCAPIGTMTVSWSVLTVCSNHMRTMHSDGQPELQAAGGLRRGLQRRGRGEHGRGQGRLDGGQVFLQVHGDVGAGHAHGRVQGHQGACVCGLLLAGDGRRSGGGARV